MAKVTVIKATIDKATLKPIDGSFKKRVAAYARVSTDSDEQYTSYETQVKYYDGYIKQHPDWEFAGVYSDEGISGTSTKKREGFNSLILKALNGEIDLILTKSISRFARNTLDTISTIRRLKAKGVEVFFEKENIWTLDSKSELILTIMASIAQEESRSISGNIKWAVRNGMKEGKTNFQVKNFLGYKRDLNGKIVIDELEAETVKQIYEWFLLDGMTATGIAEKLTSLGVFTPSGKSCNWSLLKDEFDSIYMGNDGESSMYIDLVNEEFAISSTSLKRYKLKNNLIECFRIIKATKCKNFNLIKRNNEK